VGVSWIYFLGLGSLFCDMVDPQIGNAIAPSGDALIVLIRCGNNVNIWVMKAILFFYFATQ
jgi:hypothetical protein